VRCERCGNSNPDSNRFCGSCGASLLAKSQAAGGAVPAAGAQEEKEASAGGSVSGQRLPSRSATDTARVDPSPVITGHSFLGLNKPADGEHSNRGSGHDPLGHSSGRLDYLLEDDEEPKRGWGKLALVVIALVLLGGFGYLRWKQGGFDWLTAGEKKPAAAAPSAEAPPSAADSGNAISAAGNPGGATSNVATNNPATPSPTSPPAAAPAATEAPAAQANPQTSVAENPAPQAAPPAQSSQASPLSSTPPAESTAAPAGAAAASQTAPAEAPVVPKARPPKPTPAKPVDPVAEAERYINGQGVRQDCDHGLRLLKPAAEQSNPKAMIALGALYSTGTCTPRDLPTAYRWFALALHKEPDNQPLQDDLQKLWSQMTQPERQLAIKLSQ
jgi:zinc-ribbon domain/Sel1 repeat